MPDHSEVVNDYPVKTAASKEKIQNSDWYARLMKYEVPDYRKAIGQLADTLVPYFMLWIAMVYMLHRGLSYFAVLPLVIVAAGLSVRIFIFFHDCCHNSFFASRHANRFWGYVCGILTFTPFDYWRHQHARHHAVSGDLDRRGVGDIWTMTVEEYQSAPKGKRIAYRMFRNPIVLLVIGPPIHFLVAQRLLHKGVGKAERTSVIVTNSALLVILGAAIWTIGIRTYLLIQIPIMVVAGIMGVWMFYVQHQYEGVYWARHKNWDPMAAAMAGSSYYKLPKVLQWFTGNIGLHHIHHLKPRIPNYNLQRCHDEIPALHATTELTFASSLKSMFLNVYDEASGKLVAFKTVKNKH